MRPHPARLQWGLHPLRRRSPRLLYQRASRERGVQILQPSHLSIRIQHRYHEDLCRVHGTALNPSQVDALLHVCAHGIIGCGQRRMCRCSIRILPADRCFLGHCYQGCEMLGYESLDNCIECSRR
jgi:hypothetical protein